MDRYLPPAGIDDFSRSQRSEDLRSGWNQNISDILGQVRDPAMYTLASPLFYDQLADTSGVPDGAPVPVPWNGFPLRLTKWYGAANDAQANAAAEQMLTLPAFGFFQQDGTAIALPFRIQDEYCEWFVDRVGDKVQRISFTCEPPEYWEFLAKIDFDLAHTLYEELLHKSVPADDLRWTIDVFQKDDNGKLVKRYSQGDYNPWNVWNTTKGAVHLTHPANSLFAEIALGSDSTLGWPVSPNPQGQISEIDLMCCAGRGGINRSSDPLIMKGVFGLARQGLSVALANPIGLYISPFTLGGLLDPSSKPIGAQALQLVRRSTDGTRILRVEVALPTGASYSLDQCSLDGNPLRYGGQIARNITMRLFGVGKKIPGKAPRKVKTCPDFCCFHPQHAEFRGTFRHSDFNGCADITTDDWNQEAFDIPTAKAGAFSFARAEGAIAGSEAVLVPRGRRVEPVSRQQKIDLGKYE
jgi:hypothetical protein